jgi:hypothetical protein
MQTNPNIILSGNQMAQPRLPDVNAMMQTRTAGMENIYNIEQARAETARLEQERQAKTQEDAMIKALLPAYTYGIQTGDVEGAGGLVPPEIRPQIQPYIDALRGKTPEEVKSALIGSLSSLGQTGQEALAAIQRAETIGIQRGQLGVSRQRLAQDAAKMAAEAAGAGQPKVSFRETDAEGNVRMYDAAGNEIGMLPKAGKPTAPAGGGGATTESERLAGYNAGRALDAAKRIATAITTAPEATAPSWYEAAIGKVVDPNIVRSEGRQRVTAAQRELIDALLTLATGAAYNKEQLEGQMESYIPKWTDQPGTREDKRAALLGLIQNAKIKAGRAWTPEMDAAFEQLLTPLGGGTETPTVAGEDPELDELLNKYLPK